MSAVDQAHSRWWVLGKYLLFQVPGWLVAGTLAWAARGWFGLPDWAAVTAVVLWVLKDFVLFPFLRVAYEPHDGRDRRLLGSRATAADTLAPEGFVRVGSELWRAHARGGVRIEAGARVRVHEVQGLTLVVDAEPPSPDTSG